MSLDTNVGQERKNKRSKSNLRQDKIGASKLRSESSSDQSREVLTLKLFVNNIKSLYL